jgi:hypothetical protein
VPLLYAGSVRRGDNVGEGRRGPEEPSMAESQLSELQNMRVLVEEARLLARNLAYHRRAKLEERLDLVLFEVDQQIENLRADRGGR